MFLGKDEILSKINKLKDIKVVMIHNRLDLICPFKGAYDVYKKLPKSELIVVPEFGHVGKLLYKTIDKVFGKILK